MSGGVYSTGVKGKTAEQILAQAESGHADLGAYLIAAAQVRSNEELIAALRQASSDSEKTANKIVYLTIALVIGALLQAIATGWPYLVWWHHH